VSRDGLTEHVGTFAYAPFQVQVTNDWSEKNMSIGTILLILLVLLLIGALPSWPYSGGWGYYPSGGLGLVLIVLLVLVVTGRL
jgi:hypothetical protein